MKESKPTKKKRLTPREIDDVRIVITHALTDMKYGGGGTYSIDPSGEQIADERLIKRAKLGIAHIARWLEEQR